jgi:hypothetical protein
MRPARGGALAGAKLPIVVVSVVWLKGMRG